MTTLFDSLQLGELKLANRVVMAPMTRSRADGEALPNALMVDYYRQRASAGLIVAEGTAPSPHGLGYCRTPGIYNDAQVSAWRAVTDAVHREGGLIALQLMHCGRIGSHLNKPRDARTVAPSALRAAGEIYTDAAGMQDQDLPQALSLDEISGVVTEYAQATQRALDAGFDAVELHCTSGYLPMQFLAVNSNQRNDDYGGSVSNRTRFVVEVLQGMVAIAGGGRVGLRICPGNPFNDVVDPAPAETYGTLLNAIRPLRLAYLHVMRSPDKRFDAYAMAREKFQGALILNDGFDAARATKAISDARGEAISFGRHFIGNPDLVRRLREQLPLASFDLKTLYTPGLAGYTDYPAA